jgi:excisionase family DNA binding protein
MNEINPNNEPLMTVQEVAKYLGISEGQVYKLAKTDITMKVRRIGPGKKAPIRFSKSEIDTWSRERGVQHG